MTEELVDIDTMLSHAGDFGRYQIMLMLLFSIINIFSAFHYFGQTFISVVPEHSCRVIDYNSNMTTANECSIIVNENGSRKALPCTNGWVYATDHTYGFISIVEELNWVCSNGWKSAIGQSVFFIGSVIGSLSLGILADRIGRLHVLVIANFFAFLGNLLTVFTTSTTIFALSRFLAGCATDSNFVMMYIIVMEYMRPSLRTMGLNLCIGVFYCLSCMAVPWLAVLVKTWKTFLLVVSLPHLSVFLFYRLVPESAQWLISKNRIDEAIQCFKKIATINGRTITPAAIEGLRRYCEQNIVPTEHESLYGLLKTPKLRRKTFILIFKSMVMTLCYDAISRNVNGLKYSPFLVFSVTSFTILPACIFILAVQDKAGRKALASGSLLLSGIFTAGSAVVQSFIYTPEPVLILSLAVVARLGINVAYNSGAQYAVELIPTVVRGQGVSAIHVAGYAASFFSPQILYLSHIWRPAPEIILGSLLVLGALACLFLPETLNKTLPVTLKDGEEFGEGEGLLEFACCRAPTESTTALHPQGVKRY